MLIRKYGIVLERLREEDLELVRNWRNSDHVKLNMHFQGNITDENQEKWFQTLDKSKNIYFIIITDGKKIGLINIKDINWNLKTAEAGIFIGDTNYLNTMIPVLATVTIMEMAFDNLKLTTLKAKMSAANEKVIEFNRRIGYKREEYQSDNQFHYYHTDRESFYTATQGIRETLSKLDGDRFEIVIRNSEMRELFLTPANFSVAGLKITISN
jgi:UDP-4-amino-4,6-dideoxy-N-acetyl-beta-L-altrosamine N-acetyltransferase